MAFTKSCSTKSQPSRVRRTVVLAGVQQASVASNGTVTECTRDIGAAPKTMTQVLLYTDFNPLQAEFDTIELQRARNGLAPEGFAVGVGTYRFSAKTYISPAAYPNVAPNFDPLLRSCGWRRVTYTDNSSNAHGLTTSAAVVTTASGTTADFFGYTPALGATGMTGNATVAAADYKYAITITNTAAKGQTTALKGSVDTNLAVSFDPDTATSVRIDLDSTDLATVYSASTVYVNLYRTKWGGSNFYLLTSLKYVNGVCQDSTVVDDVIIDAMPDNELTDPLPTETASGGSRIEWTPQNGDPISLGNSESIISQDPIQIVTYLDSRYHVVTGCRGSWSFQADSAQPVEMSFDLRGVYNPSTKADNISALSTPAFPSRLNNIGLKLYPSEDVSYFAGVDVGSYYSPVVKSLGFNANTATNPRNDAQQAEGILEYGIYGQYNPRLTMTVEVDKSKDIDFIECFKNGLKFSVVWTIGKPASGSATYFEFYSSGDGSTSTYSCQLATAPQYTDNNELRTWSLELVMDPPDNPTNANEANFCKIVQKYA